MFDELPEDWLSGKTDVSKLSDQAIEFDMWDEADNAKAINQIPPYAKGRRDLTAFTEKLGHGNGRPAIHDAFWSLLKAEPTAQPKEAMRPDHLVNWTVAQEMLELDELSRMRIYSVNDDVQAALSASVLEPELETLFDRLKAEQDQAEELFETLKQIFPAAQQLEQAEADLDAMMAAMMGTPMPGGQDGDEGQPGDGSPDGLGASGDQDGDESGASDPQEGTDGSGGDEEGDGSPELTDEQAEALDAAAKAVREAQEKLEELQAEAKAQAGQLADDLKDQSPTIATILAHGMESVLNDAQAAHVTSQAWGLQPGELQRMNAQERMELAKRLNNERFRKIADRFGPMKNMMFSEQARKSTDIPEEMFDIETGNNLAHILPSELLLFGDDDLEWEFYRRFAEKGLMQYAFHGEEKLARGGIIFCEDGSGSMAGDREIWSKAVMLCLLHLARQQKRTMHVLHFGSPGQLKQLHFVKPEDFTLDNILDAAEIFWNGGTDFVTPMKAALQILQDEFAQTGGVKADVVFITDDECYVDDEFMTTYLDEMHRMDATTWGVTVNGRMPDKKGALSRMAEGKVCMVKDFVRGDDARDVFRTVT